MRCGCGRLKLLEAFWMCLVGSDKCGVDVDG